MEIPVFVINLKRSVERREHTAGQLDKLGVPFQIIEAVDMDDLSETEISNNPDFGIYRCGWNSRYLRKGEIGCTLSHLKIYRKMVEENIDQACILEDDNDYSNIFKELLNPEIFKIADWDLLYLGHHSGYLTKEAQSRRKIQLKSFNYFIGEAIELPHGSYAYIIKLKAARRLLDSAYPVKAPFDQYLGNAPALGINTYLITPQCVTQSSSLLSTVTTDREINYLNRYWRRVWLEIRKIFRPFPFLRRLGIWIYLNRNFTCRFLRKTGIINNKYAKY